MRPKARLLLLLVVVPVVVVGLVVTVGRAVLGDDADSASSTVALSDPPPITAPEGAEESDPDPTTTKAPKQKSRATPTRTARSDAKKSEPAETTDEKKKSSESASKPDSAGTTSTTFASQVVKLTNSERTKAGCKALKSDAQLKSAAQKHSADMAKRDYFSHTSKDGRSPFDRMTDAGYAYSAAAENIAAGQRTPADVVKGWMNSAGHKANILNCAYSEIGVGYAKGGSYGTYWTQDFGKPA